MLMFMYNSSYAQVVKGRLIDGTTEEPVKDALIYLMPSQKSISGMQVSDSLGFFSFNNVPHKRFYIKTYRLGYDDLMYGKLIMPKNDTLSLVITLNPSPFVLKEVPVVGEKPDSDKELDAVGFYRRKAVL